MTRFVDIDLSRLKAPDVIQPADAETNFQDRITRFKTSATALNVPYDVNMLETDPVVIREQSAAYFDTLLQARVNDAARAVRLAYAAGSDLDHIAAEFGVERLAGESDESLRRRRQLVIEAFSTAGPEGAYLFFALASHPEIIDAAIYDPHSGLCDPGQVLVVIGAKTNNGAPRPAIMDSAADFLDARTVKYADHTQRTRIITREQKLRPITDWVIVEAASDFAFNIDAVLKVPYGPDLAVLKTEATTRLSNYLESRKRVGAKVSDSSISAALHVTDEDGVALVEDIDLTLNNTDDNGDVDPGPKGMARASSINIQIQVV